MEFTIEDGGWNNTCAKSIMAGALMMGTDGPPIIGALTEYRGESYAIGGNQGATTIAKFVQRYSPTVKGASIGQRIGSTCGSKYTTP